MAAPVWSVGPLSGNRAFPLTLGDYPLTIPRWMASPPLVFFPPLIVSLTTPSAGGPTSSYDALRPLRSPGQARSPFTTPLLPLEDVLAQSAALACLRFVARLVVCRGCGTAAWLRARRRSLAHSVVPFGCLSARFSLPFSVSLLYRPALVHRREQEERMRRRTRLAKREKNRAAQREREANGADLPRSHVSPFCPIQRGAAVWWPMNALAWSAAAGQAVPRFSTGSAAAQEPTASRDH